MIKLSISKKGFLFLFKSHSIHPVTLHLPSPTSFFLSRKSTMITHILFLAALLISIFNNASGIRLADTYGFYFKGKKVIRTVKYAQIPKYQGKPASIVGITSLKKDLYVCTSVSGGLIYKVSPTPKGPRTTVWFNVTEALKNNGRALDFSNRIEGGIRSIAFHPDYEKNNRFYISVMESVSSGVPFGSVFFSRPKSMAKVNSVVYEFKRNANTGRPIIGSMREVIRIGFANYFHVLKQLIFQGNNLLITHGDGAADEDVNKGGQSLTDGLGKILRINPLPFKGKPYSIPRDNPFVNGKGVKWEIFAFGFHNPHNLCLGKNGDLFVADTGRDNVEEINIIRGVKGSRNYGWPKREGHFKHEQRGGVGTGVSKPDQNKIEGFVYPSAVVPHFATRGKKFVGQSIASSCPIENKSPLGNTLIYVNFPTDGQVYYSFLDNLRAAKTYGKLKDITWATTYRADVLYDHDGKASTPPKKLQNLRAVIRMEKGLENEKRVDVRFGKGSNGKIYWSSKKSGWIYEISNSL